MDYTGLKCSACGNPAKSLVIADYGSVSEQKILVCARCQEFLVQAATEMGFTRSYTGDDRHMVLKKGAKKDEVLN